MTLLTIVLNGSQIAVMSVASDVANDIGVFAVHCISESFDVGLVPELLVLVVHSWEDMP